MSSSSKRFLLRHPTVVDTGCSCRSSKLSSFFSFSSSQSHKTPKTPFFSTPSVTTTTSQSDFSHDDSQSSSPSLANLRRREKKQRLKKKGAVEQSVAVVKESWNPYLDFRESMMVMIVEKEIYDWDSLCELLNQFLNLNSSDHHHHILRAFAEICNYVFSPFAGGGGGGGGGAGGTEMRGRKERGLEPFTPRVV